MSLRQHDILCKKEEAYPQPQIKKAQSACLLSGGLSNQVLERAMTASLLLVLLQPHHCSLWVTFCLL